MASLLSSSTTHKWIHDVFLSFGRDTHRTFTDHLHNHLHYRNRILTFRNEEELPDDDSFSQKILSEIKASRISIVVLSKDYFSSTWCLDELTKIIQCKEDSVIAEVLPFFYKVDPYDVREQTGICEEAFAKHSANGVEDFKMQKWRDTLRKVADIKGWKSSNWFYESDMVEKISDVVWRKIQLTRKFMRDDELVGVDPYLELMAPHLDAESGDHVVFAGIYGTGGIGKTTLARVIYERILDQFEICCFIYNIKERFQNRGLPSLQREFLSDILFRKIDYIWESRIGFTMIERALFKRKVLLVLDDVDDHNQINGLVPKQELLGNGSRIIITTRKEGILQNFNVERRWEINELGEDEALRLLSLHAFLKSYPEKEYLDLAKSVVKLTGGIPLKLEAVGSSLRNHNVDEWKLIIVELERKNNAH